MTCLTTPVTLPPPSPRPRLRRSGRSITVTGSPARASVGPGDVDEQRRCRGAPGAPPSPARLERAGEQVGRADEAGDEDARRRGVDLLRRADLLDLAAAHHGDAVAHRQRLALVVGDEDERDPDLALDPLELDLHRLAQLEVEGGERLVEQQGARQVDERPGQGDALLLAAGQLGRAAAGELGEADDLEHLHRPAPASRPRRPSWPAARTPRCRTPTCAGTARTAGRRC